MNRIEADENLIKKLLDESPGAVGKYYAELALGSYLSGQAEPNDQPQDAPKSTTAATPQDEADARVLEGGLYHGHEHQATDDAHWSAGRMNRERHAQRRENEKRMRRSER